MGKLRTPHFSADKKHSPNTFVFDMNKYACTCARLCNQSYAKRFETKRNFKLSKKKPQKENKMKQNKTNAAHKTAPATGGTRRLSHRTKM